MKPHFNFSSLKLILPLTVVLFISSCQKDQNTKPQNNSSGNGYGPGIDNYVYSSVVYNGNLIVGGNFSAADKLSVNSIVQWDGSNWSTLGSGMPVGVVSALTIYNGNLVAGGSFSIAGGNAANNIAQWNGTTWSALGSGTNSQINALAVYNGNLIAAGYFDSAGGIRTKNIAMWNGSKWQSLGSGLNNWVMALTVYNGSLIASGKFDSAGGIPSRGIAQWNGTNWSPLGSGFKNIAFYSSLAVWNGNLIAGGYFDSAGGVPANGIAQWNGSNWSGMGTPAGSGVEAITIYNGNLVIGKFSGTNTYTSVLEQWNGSSWSSPIGGNIESFAGPGGPNYVPAYTNTLTVYNGNLIAGGLFDALGNSIATNIAQWNGTTWSAL